MAISVIEELGHSLSGGTAFTAQYTIVGATNMAQAKVALLNPGSTPDFAPPTRPETYFDWLKIQNIDGPTEVATETWKATVTWGPKAYPQPGEVVIKWGATAGTVHVNEFLELEDAVAIEGASPHWSDFAVGVDSQGVAQGVDVPQAQPYVTLEAAVEYNDVTEQYRNFLLQAAYDGVINNTTFYGFKPGELQFLGCDFTGTPRMNIEDGDPTAKLVFQFAAAPNFLYDPAFEAAYLAATGLTTETGVTIPGMRRRLSKPGHAYIDARTETITVTGEAPPTGKGYSEDTDTLSGGAGVVPTEWKTTRVTQARTGWLNKRIDYALFNVGTAPN